MSVVIPTIRPATAADDAPAAASALRRQIHELVAQYAELTMQPPPFDPQRSPVPVSGREGVPKPGKYRVMSKSEFSQSIFFPEIKMKWSVRFAISPNGKNTISFHSIPTCAWEGGHCSPVGPMQTVEQLGTFQSGGCVRMLESDAEFLHNFVEVGTRVLVLA